jgi:hypothetical protein
MAFRRETLFLSSGKMKGSLLCEVHCIKLAFTSNGKYGQSRSSKYMFLFISEKISNETQNFEPPRPLMR